ncbi:MAG: GDSL family lipase [Armatimonadetes bacterium]|nr:GDSL family lipase [Armatimonadota bacterium]MDE2207693.1 GDSL family lipase [Armatimonadota bacterium]
MRTAFVTLSLVCVFCAALAGAQQTALPVSVAPSNRLVRTIGRWDVSDPHGPRCAWPASEMQFRFRGSAASIAFNESGNDEWQVVVDGVPTAVLRLTPGGSMQPVAADLRSGAHTVSLVKRTEAFVGTTQITAIELSASGRLLPLPRPSARNVEVIGDSISCGYGNLGKDQYQHFSVDTEDAYLSYGAVAARLLGANYTCVAWSGRKLWPDNTIPEIYNRTLPQDAASRWDYSRWTPSAIVINLATNDFGAGIPDEAAWTGAYESFIARLLRHYPAARIYCASGPMMSDAYPPGKNALTTLIAYLGKIVADEHAAGNRRVAVLEFATQDAKNGYGSDWHPSVKTDAIMAETMARRIGHDEHWKLAP